MRVFLQRPIVKRLSALMGGTAIGQLVLLASTPLLTQLYSPAIFNDFGVYLSISGILSVVATARLDIAIPMADSNIEAVMLTKIALFFVSISSLFSFLVVLILLKLDIINVTLNPFFMASGVAIAVVLIGVYQTLNYLHIRFDEFEKIGQTRVVQGSAMAIAQIGLGLLSPVPVAMIGGDVLGRSFGIASLYRLFRRVNAPLAFPEARRVLSKYRKFPLYSAPSGFINSLGVEAPTLIFAALYLPSQVGVFVFANRLMGSFVSLFSKTLAQIFLGEIGKSENSLFVKIFNKYLTLSLIISIFLVVFSLIIVQFLFPLIFNQEFANSVSYIQLLLFVAVFQIPAVTLSQTINVSGKNERQLYWDIFRACFVITSMLIGNSLYNNIYTTCVFFAAASAISYGLLIFISSLSIRRSNVLQENS